MRAGGNVRDDRIDGYLKMSRALGHFKYKDKPELAPELQIITAYPSVVTHQVADDDEFFIIASNGKYLWPNTYSYLVLTDHRVVGCHVWAVGNLFRATWDRG